MQKITQDNTRNKFSSGTASTAGKVSKRGKALKTVYSDILKHVLDEKSGEQIMKFMVDSLNSDCGEVRTQMAMGLFNAQLDGVRLDRDQKNKEKLMVLNQYLKKSDIDSIVDLWQREYDDANKAE